jgi:lipid II:glycine glycyltransferase (peptidoglycan interpeptide bridge formation enzyme)
MGKNESQLLDLKESFEMLKKLNLAKYITIRNEKELSKINFPYFMKISTSEHKTEKKAIKKCSNLQEARDCFKDFKKRFPDKEIVIQEQIEGIEIIIGLKEDRVFGKLILIGFGGIFTEITKDISFRCLPIKEKEIDEMINELKMSKILSKRKRYNIKNLKKTILKVSKLKVREVDLNPVILNEENAYIVDARIIP